MSWEKQFNTDDVLDKAMQAFWTHGYEATSMRELVDRTRVNRGSLYATYGDKHALFVAALRMYDEKMRCGMLSELEDAHGPREAIRQIFLAFTARVSPGGGNRGCFLTNTALELAAHDPEVGKIVANAQEGIEAFFVRMIEKGKAQGEIAACVKPVETARGLLASLLGLVVLIRSRPDRTLLAGIVDDAIQRLD